jgi:hypothetical protein
MAVSEFLNRRVLGVTLLGTPFTSPNTVFVALISSLSSFGLSYSEFASAAGYARQVIVLGALTNNKHTNVNTINFGTATGTWGVLRYLGVCNCLSAGDLLYYERLPYPRTIVTSTAVRILPGQITLSLMP